MKNIIFITIFIFIITSSFAEILNYDKVIQNLKGLKYYGKDQYKEAESEFSSNSMNHPKEPKLLYNLANSQYKNGKLEEAENSYKLALRDKEFNDRSQALQNLGNVKFQQKDYKNAISNFRDALMADPSNQDARYNYELAERLLQREQEQKQNQQQQNDDENKEKNKEKEKSEQQKENDEKQENQEQQKKEKKEQDEKQEQEQNKVNLKKAKEKKEAEEILKALLQKEKEEMKKEKEKIDADKIKSGKYW